MPKIVFLLLFFLLTGCASIANSRWQELTIVTVGESEPDTRCTVSNEEGIWDGVSPKDRVNIHRDGNPLNVMCKNGLQKGESSVHPQFKANLLVADILFDLCTISCLIDAGYNSWYEYPGQIVVKMSPN